MFPFNRMQLHVAAKVDRMNSAGGMWWVLLETKRCAFHLNLVTFSKCIVQYQEESLI